MGFLYNTAGLEWEHALHKTELVTLDAQLACFYVDQRLAVYRHLIFLGAAASDAQEVVQDAFLALYRVLLGGENVENWRAWLFHAARNLAVNRFKAAGPKASVAGIEDQLVSDSADPETLAIAAQRRENVFKAIAALSPQQRECLQLRAEGFAYREIAGIMGLKTSTVGEFLQRGIRQLRKAGL